MTLRSRAHGRKVFGAILALIAAAGIAACTAHGREVPSFVRQIIEEYEAAPESSSPGGIWRYDYRGETVFYVPLSRVCCDRFSVLYDAAGEAICMPDGGITGSGDGRCENFFTARSAGVQVWRDSRADPDD